MNRQTKLRLALFMGVLLLVAIGIGYWYFGIHKKTPDYAIQMVQRSLEQHDKALFHRYVDVDRLLNSSYDGFLEGVIEVDTVVPEEARSAIGNFTHIMKGPIIASFKEALDHYVETGNWTEDDLPENASIASELWARSGLQKIEFRSVDDVVVDAEGTLAIANLRVYQKEAGREFVLDVALHREKNGNWQVAEIRNLRDFITMVGEARRTQLEQYLDATAEIIERHDRTIRNAELKYSQLLSNGSLGNQTTRDEIKDLMENVFQKDWEERRQELFSVAVPDGAQTLHHLRLRICDLYIDYARDYATWMTDKKAGTIREADAKLKQAKTLELEAKTIARRMGAAPDSQPAN